MLHVTQVLSWWVTLQRQSVFIYRWNKIYGDDVEVFNLLGTSRKKHKITAVYWVLGYIPATLRSTLSFIFLTILCRADDVKQYGYPKVLEPFLRDLKILEDEGIFVPCLGKNLKGTAFCVVADNLRAQSIGETLSLWLLSRCYAWFAWRNSTHGTCPIPEYSYEEEVFLAWRDESFYKRFSWQNKLPPSCTTGLSLMKKHRRQCTWELVFVADVALHVWEKSTRRWPCLAGYNDAKRACYGSSLYTLHNWMPWE